jgi:class 3 adenylate cyclase
MTNPLQQRYPEERRWATVLFADVQGFTTLSERLDFESVSDLIKDVWIRLDEVIRINGGYIDKHLGDGVMAVWGAPFAGESDAEQAVTAGVGLLDALEIFTKESRRPGAGELKIRVGINTGPVLAGYVGAKEEYTVMGDTVNVANRMEQMAEAGIVLISESTYRLVRGLFKVRRLDNMELKGKTQPINAYIVEGRLERPTKVHYRSGDILDTRMVAREKELEKIFSLYHQANTFVTPTLTFITGESGIGKSRLLMEFSNQIEISEPELSLISTRALAQTSRVPFFLWKSLWHNRFGIQDDDPPDDARDKFLLGIRNLWGLQIGATSSIEAAHVIGGLTGIKWPASKYLAAFEHDAEGRVNKAFELTRELLRRACNAGPTILLLDDLHWADNLSLDLLNYLLKPADEPLPLFILTGTRPELLRNQPRWTNVSHIIPLGPLPIKAEIVAAAYPDLSHLPEEVMLELARRSDGNPYFLEEMVRNLVKAGMVSEDTPPEEMIARLRSRPPESLRAMLQSRLDALSREARMVALLASVVGRVFWVGAILAAARSAVSTGTGLLKLAPSMLERVIQDALRQLVQAELAFPRAGSRFSEDQEYIFKHSMLREVAYGLIPHKYLRQYHHAVARWVIVRSDPKFQVMAADHLEKAGALFEAARQYEHAALYAKSRGAKEEATWLISQAGKLREQLDKENNT